MSKLNLLDWWRYHTYYTTPETCTCIKTPEIWRSLMSDISALTASVHMLLDAIKPALAKMAAQQEEIKALLATTAADQAEINALKKAIDDTLSELTTTGGSVGGNTETN